MTETPEESMVLPDGGVRDAGALPDLHRAVLHLSQVGLQQVVENPVPQLFVECTQLHPKSTAGSLFTHMG